MKQWSTEADWDNSQSSDAIVTHDQKGEYPPSVVETQPQLAESGIVEINKTVNLGRTKEVEFEKEYETPVIITQTVTNNDPDSIGSGTKNVTEDSFEIYLDYDLSLPDNLLLPDPPSTDTGSKGVAEDISGDAESYVIDNGSIQLCSAYEALSLPVGKHATEKVAYLVIEAGGYDFGGIKVSSRSTEAKPERNDSQSYPVKVNFNSYNNLPGHAASNMTRRNGVRIDVVWFTQNRRNNSYYVPVLANKKIWKGIGTETYLINNLDKEEKFGSIVYTIDNGKSSNEYIEAHQIGRIDSPITVNFENNYDNPPLVFISTIDHVNDGAGEIYEFPSHYVNPNVERDTDSVTITDPPNPYIDEGYIHNNRKYTLLVVDQEYGWNPDSHRSQVRATLTTEKK